jgi:uncharacterized membrane protein YagU involved in acid resistance
MATKATTLKHECAAGIYGGLVGGIIFGLMMAMMGMLPMVAGVIGMKSAFAGFSYHLVNSAIIGALFVLCFSRFVHSYKKGAIFGLIYGAAWWVMGPLILMPSMMGMGARLNLEGMSAALPSLWGHLIFGVVMGLVYYKVMDTYHIRITGQSFRFGILEKESVNSAVRENVSV